MVFGPNAVCTPCKSTILLPTEKVVLVEATATAFQQQEQSYGGGNYDAPTKPLPPEPPQQDIDDNEPSLAESSSSEEEEKEIQNIPQLNTINNSEENGVQLVEVEDRAKPASAEHQLELLELSDEYDKHPKPESVEFIDTKNNAFDDISGRPADPFSKEEDCLIQTEDERYSNNDGETNTSPSQDSFQMLDMTTSTGDFETNKPTGQSSEDLLAKIDHGDYTEGNDEPQLPSMAVVADCSAGDVARNDDVEQPSLAGIQPLVQFDNNSSNDDHVLSPASVSFANMSEEDALKQTSKEFVDDLMEEALTITAEQQKAQIKKDNNEDDMGAKHPETTLLDFGSLEEHQQQVECAEHDAAFAAAEQFPKEGDKHQGMMLDNDTVGDQILQEEDEFEKKPPSRKSSTSSSPKELMEELLGSVPPPSTSPPPKIISDEQEEMLRDAQKDDSRNSSSNENDEMAAKEETNAGEELEEHSTTDKKAVTRDSSSDYDEEAKK